MPLSLTNWGGDLTVPVSPEMVILESAGIAVLVTNFIMSILYEPRAALLSAMVADVKMGSAWAPSTRPDMVLTPMMTVDETAPMVGEAALGCASTGLPTLTVKEAIWLACMTP